ncbi:MAG: hypothetical protein K9J74_00245 [Sulfuritalea sp.]|nr:hypothetical protein [Sulfuritalea sp.]
MLLEECKIPFKKAAKDSRLWVIAYNSTPLLEALVANVPFVSVWNPAHCINRLSLGAGSLFHEVKRCGVFHETPESAAQTVNEHFADPARWWRSEDIQRVRREFCDQFASTKRDWLDIWAKKLEGLLKCFIRV